MNISKMYFITVIEIIIFLFVGYFLSELVLSEIYESAGIPYVGRIGVIWFGISFVLFCVYTLFRSYFLKQQTPILKDRISSATFKFVFLLSLIAVFYPFVFGQI